MYYVFDLYGVGCCDVFSDYDDTSTVDRLMSSDDDCIFIGKYDTYEDAEVAASDYESECQDEVDKATGNYDDDDYVELTEEDYLLD